MDERVAEHRLGDPDGAPALLLELRRQLPGAGRGLLVEDAGPESDRAEVDGHGRSVRHAAATRPRPLLSLLLVLPSLVRLVRFPRPFRRACLAAPALLLVGALVAGLLVVGVGEAARPAGAQAGDPFDAEIEEARAQVQEAQAAAHAANQKLEATQQRQAEVEARVAVVQAEVARLQEEIPRLKAEIAAPPHDPPRARGGALLLGWPRGDLRPHRGRAVAEGDAPQDPRGRRGAA